MHYPTKGRTAKARALRRNQTESEAILWERLRNRKLLGFKFRRQHVINDYIVDFFCREKRLVLEIDGPYHDDPIQKGIDKYREQTLIENGYYILRFNNDEVLNKLSEVIEKIELFLKQEY